MSDPAQQSLPGLDDDLPLAPDPAAATTAPAADACRPASPPPSPATLEGQRVFIIDAHSIIHQVFHALPEMSSPRGEPVGAVFGFARDLFFLIEEKQPDYLFCAFDLPGKTFRHALYDRYKINRPSMHVDLAPQIVSIRRLIEAMNIPALGCEAFEADDVLATVARMTEDLGGECYLVTGDKDCRQLITSKVKVYNLRKDLVLDAAALMEDWGVRPDQVVDFQSLVGDATDNVPGVPLVGPKLAQQLLQKYGTLEEVLGHADEVAGAKRKENLKNYAAQALLSRELVRLRADVPIAVDWPAGRQRPFDLQRLRALLDEFGFRSLVSKVDGLRRAAGEAVPAPGAQPAAVAYHLVDTPELFSEFVERLRRQKRISFDTETTSICPRSAELVGYALAFAPDEGYYLPVRGPAGERLLDPAATAAALKPILEDADVEKVGQNLKYDMVALRTIGIRLAGVVFDTMVASYLLDAGSQSHKLDELAKRYLDHETIKIDALIGSGKNQKRMDEVPTRRVADYAGEDAVLPLRLIPILEARLEAAGLLRLFHEVELPLIDVLAELEFNGVKVDAARLAELGVRFAERMEALAREIETLAGHPFNLGSPKQLQQVLFAEQGLPVLKKTKTGPSTDAEVLEELAPLHPLPAKILEYRQYAKLKGTYIDAMQGMVNPSTGRVHASFNQHIAATGRLSSSDPNLQNIPIRTEEGRAIRSAFVPGDEGWLLLAADYSQIELRVLAHFSGDERLCAAFAADADIHAAVAAGLYQVPLAEVTEAMRRRAKTVNFGVIYGQSPFGLAKQLGIDQTEAAQFIDAYFQGYPGIEQFMAATLAECRRNGYVSTVLGRRRAIEGVRPQPGRQKNLAERTAINSVIQGSAADLIKLAMIAVHRRLSAGGPTARMLLQIHDELVFEVPASHLDELADLVATEMAAVGGLRVPLKVDLKAGPNWAEARPWRRSDSR